MMFATASLLTFSPIKELTVYLRTLAITNSTYLIILEQKHDVLHYQRSNLEEIPIVSLIRDLPMIEDGASEYPTPNVEPPPIQTQGNNNDARKLKKKSSYSSLDRLSVIMT